MKDYKRDLARYLKLKKANELGKIIVDDIYEKRVDREGNIIYYPDLMPDRYVSYSNMKHIIQKWNGLIVGDSFSGSYHRVLSQIKDRISEPAETVRGKPSKYFFINEECKNLLQYNDLLINEFDGIDKRINAYQRQQNNKKNTGKRRLLL
jgi:hypothetical protein